MELDLTKEVINRTVNDFSNKAEPIHPGVSVIGKLAYYYAKTVLDDVRAIEVMN